MKARFVRQSIAALACTVAVSAPAFAKDDDKTPPHPAASLKLREIGPASPSGRISDFAVHPESKAHWYVATASGGLWETKNAGITWNPLFDKQSAYALGVVEVDPTNPLTVWVGSGENNSQRSVAAGDGVYVSRDGGKKWKNVGLKNSGHISQIHIDPSDSDSVLVAAQGPLWSAGGDRGLYATSDGGDTWEPLLQVDEYTGVNEFAVHPENPDLIVASSYQRHRHVWTLINGGPGSGIHRSSDGGQTWERVKSGLPKDVMGRIGIAAAPSKPNRLYAVIEAKGKEAGFYISEDFGQNWKKQSDKVSGGPQYYHEIFVDPANADRVYFVDTYTSVTEDAGKTFSRFGHDNNVRHVDDHAVWIDPDNTDHLLIGGDGGIYETWDRGDHWRHFENLPIVQFYRVQPDNDYPFYNVCGGTQDNNSHCGPSRTTTIHGITNSDWWAVLGGDGYEPKIDPEDPNIIYPQYQYGGLARYDRRTQERVYIAPVAPEGENAYKFNWNTPLLISPHNRERLYYAAEKLFRSDDRGDSWTVVSPDLTRQIDRNALPIMGRVWSDNAIAKNTSTSKYGSIVGLHESSIMEGLIYVGTDDGLIQVTEDGGDTWRKVDSFRGVPDMSLVEDLFASAHDADVAYAVIDNHKRGDNKPYVLKTKDRGRSWRLISGDLPEDETAHTITEDPVNPNLLFVGTEKAAYATVDGGEHWMKLTGGLPTISVRDLEIQAREHDLVIGTFGRGAFILDDLSPLRVPQATLKAAEATLFPVRDALQYIPGDKWGGAVNQHHGHDWWQAKNPQFGAMMTYYLRDGYTTLAKQRRKAEIKAEKAGEDTPYPSWDELRTEDTEEAPSLEAVIRDADGNVVRRLAVPSSKGLHRVAWDLRYRDNAKAGTKRRNRGRPGYGLLALPGRYTAQLYVRVQGEQKAITEPQEFMVNALNMSPETTDDPAALLAFQQQTSRLIGQIEAAQERMNDVKAGLKLLDEALRDTPAANEALRVRLRELQGQHQALTVRMSGDRTVASRQEATPVGIRGRAGRIPRMGFGSQAPVGGQQREQYEIAERQFDAFMPELTQLLSDYEALSAQATELGAPWTPGRMPR